MNSKDFPSVIAARKAANAQLKFFYDMMNGPSTMKTINGDLLALAEAGEFDIVVQGCNCFNTMGLGLALQIKMKYPSAYAADLMTDAGDYNKLGTYTMAPSSMVRENSRFVIINAYTQYDFSRGKDVFEYGSFALILLKLAHNFPKARFGFPLIGCGLAGGDKHRILGMIEDFSRAISKTGGSVTVVEYAP